MTSQALNPMPTSYGHNVTVTEDLELHIGPSTMVDGYDMHLSTEQARDLARRLPESDESAGVAKAYNDRGFLAWPEISTPDGRCLRVQVSSAVNPSVWLFQKGDSRPVVRLDEASAGILRAQLLACADEADVDY